MTDFYEHNKAKIKILRQLCSELLRNVISDGDVIEEFTYELLKNYPKTTYLNQCHRIHFFLSKYIDTPVFDARFKHKYHTIQNLPHMTTADFMPDYSRYKHMIVDRFISQCALRTLQRVDKELNNDLIIFFIPTELPVIKPDVKFNWIYYNNKGTNISDMKKHDEHSNLIFNIPNNQELEEDSINIEQELEEDDREDIVTTEQELEEDSVKQEDIVTTEQELEEDDREDIVTRVEQELKEDAREDIVTRVEQELEEDVREDIVTRVEQELEEDTKEDIVTRVEQELKNIVKQEDIVTTEQKLGEDIIEREILQLKQRVPPLLHSHSDLCCNKCGKNKLIFKTVYGNNHNICAFCSIKCFDKFNKKNELNKK